MKNIGGADWWPWAFLPDSDFLGPDGSVNSSRATSDRPPESHDASCPWQGAIHEAGTRLPVKPYLVVSCVVPQRLSPLSVTVREPVPCDACGQLGPEWRDLLTAAPVQLCAAHAPRFERDDRGMPHYWHSGRELVPAPAPWEESLRRERLCRRCRAPKPFPIRPDVSTCPPCGVVE